MDDKRPARHKASVLGVPVTPGGVGNHVEATLDHRPAERALLITFVNPYACKLLKLHGDYRELLQRFDVVACDGIGMVRAARASGVQLQRESFDFTSLAGDVFRWATSRGATVGLVGGEEGVSERAAAQLREVFPGLRISGVFSGFGQALHKSRMFFLGEETGMVVCGMGAPHQERYLLELAEMGWSGIGFTCGGFFDQVGQGIQYYPQWVEELDLRFLYRLYKEPRRLWRRYLVDYQTFVGAYFRLVLFGGRPEARQDERE